MGHVPRAEVLWLQEAQLGYAVGWRPLVVDVAVVQCEHRSDYKAYEPDDDEHLWVALSSSCGVFVLFLKLWSFSCDMDRSYSEKMALKLRCFSCDMDRSYREKIISETPVFFRV